MENSYKISILIVTYNKADTIEKCLDSILENNYCEKEIIVVDDGSTDETSKLIEKYKDIKYFKISHKGVSYARNYAIKKCTGDYFIFVDSDDYIDSNLFNQLVLLFNNNYELIRYNAKMIENQNILEFFEYKKEGIIDGISYLNECARSKQIFGPLWLYCFKTDFYKKNQFQFPVGRIQEDFYMMPMILLKVKKMYCMNYNGYYYYRSDNSIMRNNDYSMTVKKFLDIHYYVHIILSELFKYDNVDLNTMNYYKNECIRKYHKLSEEDREKYKKLMEEYL